ncbi:MAG: tyrosine-type recombinase/integrase [Planctomycetota bacterium]|jgi:site-specific recombinase XerC
MASIFKPTYTKKDPETGERIKRQLKKWYVKYRDADGVVQKVPGYTDKAATLQLAAQLERGAELGRIGIVDPYEKHRKRALQEHINEFEKYVRDKGNSPEHVRQTVDRVRAITRWCQFAFIDDISASQVEAFLAGLRGLGRSIQTSNHYLAAMKEFCRWLVMDRRSGDSAIAHMQKQNVRPDRRHDRRALDSDEFNRLVESAMHGPPIEAVSGADRAMLYILAAWTGYRRKEISSLTLRSFDLDGTPPTVRVQAGYSKRRRLDSIPLHAVAMDRLREWLATKSDLDPDAPLFPLKTKGGHFRKTSKMMQRDLERVGLPYQDEDGLFADFHANRHTFISNLGKAGVQLKVAQALARHSDINLTMNVYTHLGVNDQASAVNDLPPPPPMAPQSPVGIEEARLRATGTDDEHVPGHVRAADSGRRGLAYFGAEAGSGGEVTGAKKNVLSGSDGVVCPAVSQLGGVDREEDAEERLLATEPKVTGSNPVGCT